MAEQVISIKNCNNIKEAQITLVEKALNIKFGYNGTGKSTICEAIRLKVDDKDGLQSLRPYSDIEEGAEPVVAELSYQNVKVFNESYIKTYLCPSNDGIFSDSFRVLLRSKECDDLSKQITELLSELQNSFIKDESIRDISNMFEEYISTVGYADGNIPKRGGINDFLKGNGAGFDKHPELEPYKPYYSVEFSKVSKWADWRTTGITHMIGDECPFCASNMDMDIIKKQNDVMKKVFKKSAIKAANQILEYLQKGIEKGYIFPNKKETMENFLGVDGKTDELYAEINQLANETDYLKKKIDTIMLFRPMNVTHEQLADIEKNLESMRVDEQYIQKFYATTAMSTLIEGINRKIDRLLAESGRLKGFFLKHESKMKKMVEDRKTDIDSFFQIAGFPYRFEIVENGENSASTYLFPVGTGKAVSEINHHLSWGERNAFALVMFMFDAISENADLIVLDDPISAFDSNKKFAVIRRLFDNKQEISFREKTVLMLTHDLQPVIDYIHGGFFKRYGMTTDVSAKYIVNEKGSIKEQIIEDTDLLNVVRTSELFAEDGKKPLHVRIVNYRKYIELTRSDFSTTEEYDVISNLIHGRTAPEDGQKMKMTEKAVNKGLQQMKLYISGMSYDKMVMQVSTKKLIDELHGDNIYYKILAIRLIFIRKEGMMTILRRDYPEACKFLNETNHIENDYIFQLNPEKYFSIPELYVTEIKEFIDKHRGELIDE